MSNKVDDLFSENRLLRRLNCTSWDELTPDRIPSLLQLLPYMKPEVADKAMDVVLSVPNLTREMKHYSQQLLNESLQSNSEMKGAVAETDRQIITGLLKQLDRQDLTSEERKEIREDIKELSEQMHTSDTENKSWISHLIDTAQNHDSLLLTAAGVVVGAFLGVFAGRKLFPGDKRKNDD